MVPVVVVAVGGEFGVAACVRFVALSRLRKLGNSLLQGIVHHKVKRW